MWGGGENGGGKRKKGRNEGRRKEGKKTQNAPLTFLYTDAIPATAVTDAGDAVDGDVSRFNDGGGGGDVIVMWGKEFIMVLMV